MLCEKGLKDDQNGEGLWDKGRIIGGKNVPCEDVSENVCEQEKSYRVKFLVEFRGKTVHLKIIW